MQTKILVSAITLSVNLILMAGSVKVNQSTAIPAWKSAGQVVDGIAMPPPGKKGYRGSNSVVDGIPMPPPKKRSFAGNNNDMVADGIPMPPPKKKLAA